MLRPVLFVHIFLISSIVACKPAQAVPCDGFNTPRTFSLDLTTNGMDDKHYIGIITLNSQYTPFFTPDSFIQDSKGNIHNFDLTASGCNNVTIVLAWQEDGNPSPRLFLWTSS
jgi:hypothetical protein